MEPKTKKILIIGGIVGALTLLAYKLMANKGKTPSNTNLVKPTIVPSKKEDEAPSIEDMPGNSNPSAKDEVSYSPEELADMLQDAFNGYGTNWSKGKSGGVVGVLLNLKSAQDFDNLNEAYGVRTISSGTFNFFQKDYVGDMNGAFNSELSKREIADANDILAVKGIDRAIQIDA
jgi:hypothetical protein